MFDPVPSYETFCESARQELNDFHARVMNYAEYYGVDYSNRFSFIITVCESLVDLRESVGRDVWKQSEKEPSADFQNLFQLLIYALGDRGLLYDQYGFWKSEPDIDFWEQSDRSYTELALAMRMRNFTYLRLQKLRKNLKSHANLQYRLNTEYTEDEKAAIGAAAIMLNKTFPSVNAELCFQIIETLLGNHLFQQAAPLYLFFPC